jgi:hypothetical protein
MSEIEIVKDEAKKRGKVLSAVEVEPGTFELHGDYDDTYQTRSALRVGFEIAATFADREGAPGLAAKLRALVVRGCDDQVGPVPKTPEGNRSLR